VDVSAAFGTVMEEDGIRVRSAEVDGFTLAELRFPSGYVQPRFDPVLPYLAFVLEGTLVKSFRSRTLSLAPANGLTMPLGATHGARFGRSGARIVIVKPNDVTSRVAQYFDRLTELRGGGLPWLAWRLAAELRASDTAAPLAAEGLALELLAATRREAGVRRRATRAPSWLHAAEELLRTRLEDCVRLRELADLVGVHPVHLARVFRAHYGVSVGEYGRRLRLDWAAAEVARSDMPLARIAARAGFADQSHFTRLFKGRVGTTPAAYRRLVRAPNVPS
jgi:AraC family transcriptional regulator